MSRKLGRRREGRKWKKLVIVAALWPAILTLVKTVHRTPSGGNGGSDIGGPDYPK
jgi:hypothetical protein